MFAPDSQLTEASTDNVDEGKECKDCLLEDETLAGVGELPWHQGLVYAERAEGGVIGETRGGDVNGGLAPTLKQCSLLKVILKVFYTFLLLYAAL